MTKKPTITTLQSGFNSTETLNANFEGLRDAFDNTLSLDGSTPNAMEADLDLNGNNLIGAAGLLVNGTDYLAEVEAAKAAALAAQAAAETAETNAETAETNAESSETAAGLSATAAATSATASAASAVDATNNGAAQVVLAAAQVTLAETAKTGAELAETNAETAESNAATSATNAVTSETNASTSASTASTKASEAATSATNAATSATEAETAKTAAETARDSALAALDSFDDRYLGVKTSDPTVDNDGDALLVGALYFNSNTDKLYIYDGASWQATTSGAAAGDLVSTNNLSDLTSAATARTNLGLGTAATTASTDYATAAQGTLADSAVQPNASPTFAGLTTTGDVSFGDNDKAIFGDGSDLQIYHSGSHSYIRDTGTGSLYIRGSDFVSIQAADGTNSIVADTDSEVTLYHNGSPKLATTSTGIDVTGTVTMDGGSTSGNFTFGDNDKAIFGASNDLTILHDGFNSFINDQGAGSLRIQTDGAQVKLYDQANSNIMADFNTGGSVDLYHNGSKKLATTSTGIDVTGAVTADGLTVSNTTGDTTVTISTTGTGDADATLVLDSADSGESVLQFEHDGVYGAKIEWFTDGSPDLNLTTVGADSVIDMQPNGTLIGRFDTTGLDVNGTVTATSYSGDGSALTGITVEGSTVKAWVNYYHNVASIRDSRNVSSVTDNATGELEVNLANAMSNATYCSSGSAGDATHSASRNVCTNDALGNTSSKVDCLVENSGGTQVDAEYVGILAIGDLA